MSGAISLFPVQYSLHTFLPKTCIYMYVASCTVYVCTAVLYAGLIANYKYNKSPITVSTYSYLLPVTVELMADQFTAHPPSLPECVCTRGKTPTV